MRKYLIIYFAIIFVISPLYAASLITGLTATGQDCRIDLVWDPVVYPLFEGYNIYRCDTQNGTFTKLNDQLHTVSVYSDFIGNNLNSYWYYIEPKVNGSARQPSVKVTATPYAMNNDELLTSIQHATFRYFWDFAHPFSGLTREWYASGRSTVAIGGSGMGLMTIVVGAERGFVTRQQAAERVLKIMTWLRDVPHRYDGVWSHFMDGTTGLPSPAKNENGVLVYAGDIVETADMIQGMLVCKQYFDRDDPVENEIRAIATQLYEDVNWETFRRPETNDPYRLWWLWSDETYFFGSHPFGGAETLNVYLLAIASPTHHIPVKCYYDGFGFSGGFRNGERRYGYTQWASDHATPMFWTHYSFLGFDPRNKWDNYCNYFENSRNISLINRAYCAIDNPNDCEGYGENFWGLTSCNGPVEFGGYRQLAAGGVDLGTIAPTAAISSMPFTPQESIAAMRNFYYNYGHILWGPFGFYDAINLDLEPDWCDKDYLSIDQGTIVPMIENYRTGLCWRLFMKNPEIQAALENIGWATRADNGLNYEYYEGFWTSLPNFDYLTPLAVGKANNFDLGLRQREDFFAFRFKGYIDLPDTNTYCFGLTSDDGSRLYIDDVLVVNNDGLHGTLKESENKYLTQGRHSITVTYFDRDGGQNLSVSYSRDGIAETEFPVNRIFRCHTNLPGDFTGDCAVDVFDLKMMAEKWLYEYDFEQFNLLAQDWMK